MDVDNYIRVHLILQKPFIKMPTNIENNLKSTDCFWRFFYSIFLQVFHYRLHNMSE